MILTQDFDTDFDLLTAGLAPDYAGEPYAFVRFGDGEAAIMRGRAHEAKSDGWSCPPGEVKPDQWRLLGGWLIYCLSANLPDFYIGISAHEHHPECWDWLNINRRCSFERVTFAELFIFANFDRFRRLCDAFLSEWITVAPHGHIEIPGDAVMTGWDHRPTVDLLINRATAPILIAGGPMANIIIHDYWLRCPPARKHVILDVGSALSVMLSGRKNRSYQHADHPQRNWKPRFWPVG